MNTFTRRIALTAPVAVLLAASAIADTAPVWQRFVLATFGMFAALKIAAVLSGASAGRPGDSAVGRVLWWFCWPGIGRDAFRVRGQRADELALLACGGARAATGLAGCLVLALMADRLSPLVLGWAGIAALLLTFHLGLVDVWTAVLRRAGFAVVRPFPDPFRSRSLREFWSRRWNRLFVEMDRLLFYPALRRLLGPRGAVFGVFVVSGLLHEFAVSYPAGGGWGTPMAYFCLHGALVLLEPALRLGRWPAVLAWLWTWTWVVVPLPLMFHGPFRDALVVPFFTNLGSLS